MKEYLDIVDNVMRYGERKENRTGIATFTLPNQIFSFDFYSKDVNKDIYAFPLLTTKKMAFRSICVELEGFIKGITSKHWFQERGCHIWDEWASPSVVQRKVEMEINKAKGREQEELIHYEAEFTKHVQKEEDDLGPLGYSWGWRRFGQIYSENGCGTLEGFDQLKYIVNMLETNPDDRRMVCSAWHPGQMHEAALPSCHVIWGLVHINGVLSLWWSQRSCDLMLGVPFNIASYALLLLLLCKHANMKPGNLTGLLADCHIYENHEILAKVQMSRITRNLPGVNIKTNNIFDWTYQDVNLVDYNPYPKITYEVAI